MPGPRVLAIGNVLVCLATAVGAQNGVIADEPSVPEMLEQARQLFRDGHTADALRLADAAVVRDAHNPQFHVERGSLRAAAGRFAEAIADFSEALLADGHNPQIYNERGSARFKLGLFEASIEDFDRAIALNRGSEAHHWQRGISYYYAGRYGRCREQFEMHRRVNPHDVENALWHFLCVARGADVLEARRKLIPIDTERDAHVPMRQLYALFAGEASVDDVLGALETDAPSVERRRDRSMYAHLYIGLWCEAGGDARSALKHMLLAGETYRMEHYMGYVAQVHLDVLRAAGPEAQPVQSAPELSERRTAK